VADTSVPVILSNGMRLLVQTSDVPTREEKVAFVPGDLKFEDVLSIIEGFATDIGGLLKRVSPDKATIEFGVEMSLEAGKLTALIVKGTGSANLKISLEWDKSSASAAPSSKALP